MIPLDTLLNDEEKSLLLKAREQYIRNPPQIIFYNMSHETTHIIPYKYDSSGILLRVKDVEKAFLLPTHIETEWETVEKVIRMVSTSVKEYIGYLYFIYSSLGVPRSDDRYNVLAIQKKWFQLGKGIDKDED